MMLLGTISAVIENAGLRLTIDGESSPTTKEYRFLSSYVPKVGDRVLVAETGDSYVVLGKVTETTQYPQANSVWNRTHSDHSFPIVFYESNSSFYIAYGGGPWHKITTS
jgi:hypothetical protein